jgi:Lon protease-like protein
MTEGREVIPIFPLNTVLLPGIALPLHIFEERYKRMVAACLTHQAQFGVVLIVSGREVGGPAATFSVGSTARILGVERLADGRMNIACVGDRRFRIVAAVTGKPYQQAEVEYWPDQPSDCDLDGLAGRTRDALARFLSVGEAHLEEALARLPAHPADLANVLAASLPVDLGERQALLEAPNLCARLERIAALLSSEARQLRSTGAVRYVAARPSEFSAN